MAINDVKTNNKRVFALYKYDKVTNQKKKNEKNKDKMVGS